MGVIGRIQKNSLLMLIVIGVAMLAFIFTDAFSNSGGSVEQLETATIYGESINQTKLEDLQKQYVDKSKSDFYSQGREFTEADKQQAENAAFDEMVRRTIMDSEFEKLGIECSTEELNDMIHGNHIHPWVQQISIFNGFDGQFSRDSVRNYINNLDVEPPVDAAPEVHTRWLDSRKQWRNFENELKDTRKADKYVALVKKGMFINKIEALDKYNALNVKKDVRYVIKRYAEILPEEVQISDEDIKAFYEEHKNESIYEQEEAADVQMIFFPVVASETDKKTTKTAITSLKDRFNSSQNNIGFVYQNSDSQFLSDSTVYKMNAGDKFIFGTAQGGSYPSSLDDIIQDAKVGDIVGPFESMEQIDNAKRETKEGYAIAKVIALPTEKQAWVRHILIGTSTRSVEQAKATADSIIRVIKANDNFVAMVTAVSEDPGSIENNGEYKWFPEGMMVPEFNDAAFNGAIGQLQLVKTSYGYHIVEVLGQAERVTPVLAIVSKNIKPSDETLRNKKELINEYIFLLSEIGGDSAINKLGADSNFTVQAARVYLSNDYVLGVNESQGLLSFAFNGASMEGDIAQPLLDGDKYILAVLDNKIEEGTPNFEDVKEAMRFATLKEKQAIFYTEKMQGNTNLEDVVSSIQNGTIRNATISFDSKSVFNGGRPDTEVIGSLFQSGVTVGSITKPIAGEEGVYVFVIDNEVPADETTDLTSVSTTMRITRMSTSDGRVIQALRENADLQDNRRKLKFQRR